MNKLRDQFQSFAKQFGIKIDDAMVMKFEYYSEFLQEWNKKMNLTAIRDPEQIIIKHFIDSLLLIPSITIGSQEKIIDIGTGAGFPGVPVKIVRPDVELTLLDSLNKRLLFLAELLRKFQFSANLLHMRAEEGATRPELREQFSIVTSRAVAALPSLCEYCLPYAEIGGMFAAMKGPDALQEIERSEHAIEELGGKLVDVKKYVLPDGSNRSIVLIKKINNTPKQYPRRGTKIAKNPL